MHDQYHDDWTRQKAAHSSLMEATIPSAHDDTTSWVHVRHHAQQIQSTTLSTPVRARALSVATASEPLSPRPYPQSPAPVSLSKSKSRRHRFRIYIYNHLRRLRYSVRWLVVVATITGVLLLLAMVAYSCFWLFHHFQCYHREAGITWREAPIHNIPRPCPPPEYEILEASSSSHVNICMTTLTDKQSPSWYQRMIRCRDFDALEQISFPNQQHYANKHNYYWKDSSHLVDPERPPAWSKLKAVQALLQQPQQHNSHYCDWVLWLDADVIIMNSNIRLQDLLPSDPEIMLIATHDRKFTANSGVWLLRNSDWSRQFLDDWWNLKAWVRRPGLSLSGDNAAFGHLVDQVLQSEPRRIQLPARCNLNSFGVFLTPQQDQEIVVGGMSVLAQQDWYLSDKFYHKGDFIVHASGIDKKQQVLEMLIQKAV